MPLLSKSIQAPLSKDDGIRICIMRKPDFEADWDIWMPSLAPSLALLRSYKKGETSWSKYILQFNKEVIIAKRDHLKLLVDMARYNTITLLCWELCPKECHRRLVLEEILRIDPSLSVVIR